jgi:hypothetical protein
MKYSFVSRHLEPPYFGGEEPALGLSKGSQNRLE